MAKFSIQRTTGKERGRKCVRLQLNRHRAMVGFGPINQKYIVFFDRLNQHGCWYRLQITSPLYKSLKKAEAYATRKIRQLERNDVED